MEREKRRGTCKNDQDQDSICWRGTISYFDMKIVGL